MIVSRALILAWMDLLRPRILRLALMGIALTILLFVVLQSALFWVVRISLSMHQLTELRLALNLPEGNYRIERG